MSHISVTDPINKTCLTTIHLLAINNPTIHISHFPNCNPSVLRTTISAQTPTPTSKSTSNTKILNFHPQKGETGDSSSSTDSMYAQVCCQEHSLGKSQYRKQSFFSFSAKPSPKHIAAVLRPLDLGSLGLATTGLNSLRQAFQSTQPR
jgi:hypothetical protein